MTATSLSTNNLKLTNKGQHNEKKEIALNILFLCSVDVLKTYDSDLIISL